MSARLLAHYATTFTRSQRLLPLPLRGDEARCHHDACQPDCLSPDAALAPKTLPGLPVAEHQRNNPLFAWRQTLSTPPLPSTVCVACLMRALRARSPVAFTGDAT